MANVQLYILLLAGGAAGCGALALWLNRALNDSWSKGYSAGETAVSLRYAEAVERNRAAAQAAAEHSGRLVAALEAHRDRLQTRLDELSSALARGGSDSAACLAPDVLRALARTGQDEPDFGSGAGQSDAALSTTGANSGNRSEQLGSGEKMGK
ncbi:MAG: hypothetical protein AB7F96_02835 [Beijerinckiaceae bacterium]